MVGNNHIEGKSTFAKALQRKAEDEVDELSISHVATHGKVGAVDGTLRLKNGVALAFCDVYEFAGAKGTSVKAITSYLIKT